MAKDPAFLWYPNDYIGGTLGMTFEEKGAYVELLMMQFNRGHMTSHMIGQVVGQTWDKIRSKFQVDEDGLFYNVRLELEIEKRKTFVESRKNNRNGVNQHTKQKRSYDLAMTSHMEDVNDNDNDNDLKEKGCGGKGRFKPPTVEEVSEYCAERENGVDPKAFVDFYTSKGWLVGKSAMKDWKASIRTWEGRNGKPSSTGVDTGADREFNGYVLHTTRL